MSPESAKVGPKPAKTLGHAVLVSQAFCLVYKLPQIPSKGFGGNGIQEVEGSIPFGSTISLASLGQLAEPQGLGRSRRRFAAPLGCDSLGLASLGQLAEPQGLDSVRWLPPEEDRC